MQREGEVKKSQNFVYLECEGPPTFRVWTKPVKSTQLQIAVLLPKNATTL